MKDNKLNYYFNYDQKQTQDVEVKLTQNAINKIKDNSSLNLNVFEGKIYKKIEIFDKSFELYGDVSIQKLDAIIAIKFVSGIKN
jgi:hypothetical protein